MRVCLVCPEVFSWGVYGGFGFLTRLLARNLVERGVEVSVVTRRMSGQGRVEELEGATVLGYSHGGLGPRGWVEAFQFLRRVDADLYHSQAISYNTYVALRAAPAGKHVVTFQDPYNYEEWRRISQVAPEFGSSLHKAWERVEAWFLGHTCRMVDGLYAQARFLVPRAMRHFRLRQPPKVLPNPVPIPREPPGKSEAPTVCFLARWDPQKRVELFLELARRFPEVRFIAMGRSHNPRVDAALRRRYGGVENLWLTGFVGEDEKQRILANSWALVNTSVREALPISFLEAFAAGTPVISGEDPDGLVSRFGFKVQGMDYGEGIKWLLESDEWLEKGGRARRYVEENHEEGLVADLHIREYGRVLGG